MLNVLMEESQNIRLEHERRSGNISGLEIARGVRRINNSQIVDDTLFLGGDYQTMANRFKMVLD